MKKEKVVRLVAWIYPDDMKRIKAEAKKKNVSMSQVVREFIRQ